MEESSDLTDSDDDESDGDAVLDDSSLASASSRILAADGQSGSTPAQGMTAEDTVGDTSNHAS